MSRFNILQARGTSGRLRMILNPIVAALLLCGLSGCGEDTPPNDEALDNYLAYLDEYPEITSPNDLAAAAMEFGKLNEEHPYDYFKGMDVAFEARLAGQPLSASDRDQRQITLTQDEWQGRNTWMMWTAGNAAFWDLLARESNGLVDLLKLLDARHIAREDRFRVLGLVPEPGMKAEDGSQADNKYGLWLDQRDDSYGNYSDSTYSDSTSSTVERGVPNEDVYGLPSGIVGLRLFKNPNFDEAAAEHWDAERYINEENYYKDPSLVRPYRVGMACAFCHVSYNPLRPPTDPRNPRWENLAANVGNQYFRVGGIFGYDMRESTIIRQLLNTSPPGTIDTSLVATDGNNNPNTMNAIYGVLERIAVSLQAKTAEEFGPKFLDDEQNTQDFLMIAHNRFFAANAKDFADFFEAIVNGRLAKWFGRKPIWRRLDIAIKYILFGRRVSQAQALLAGRGVFGSPLEITWFGISPYRLGPNEVVKYQVRPVNPKQTPIPKRPSQDYLRERMVRQLAEGSVDLEFRVQRRTDPNVMPLEDTSRPWDESLSPFVTLATIRVLQQDFDTPQRREFDENLSFNPWHCIAYHQPLGGVNRARRHVMKAISDFRLERNGVPRIEPTIEALEELEAEPKAAGGTLDGILTEAAP